MVVTLHFPWNMFPIRRNTLKSIENDKKRQQVKINRVNEWVAQAIELSKLYSTIHSARNQLLKLLETVSNSHVINRPRYQCESDVSFFE
jgi:hypothetical protein